MWRPGISGEKCQNDLDQRIGIERTVGMGKEMF
jgi:hypothetical protein